MPNGAWWRMRAKTLEEELRQAKLATRREMGRVEEAHWERDEALRRVQELEHQTRAET